MKKGFETKTDKRKNHKGEGVSNSSSSSSHSKVYSGFRKEAKDK